MDYIMEAVSGRGPLQAYYRMPPTQDLRNRLDVILGLVKGKSVLHVGCTDHLEIIDMKIGHHTLLHQRLSESASECLGVDIDAAAAEHLRVRGIENIIVADVTKPGISEIAGRRWDCLLLADIIEHIDDPVLFLKTIAANYREHIGSVVITVPNAFGLNHMLTAQADGAESINRDHRYWFTPYTLCKVAYHAGLAPDSITMCANEYTAAALEAHRETVLNKPLLLDTVALEAHWAPA